MTPKEWISNFHSHCIKRVFHIIHYHIHSSIYPIHPSTFCLSICPSSLPSFLPSLHPSTIPSLSPISSIDSILISPPIWGHMASGGVTDCVSLIITIYCSRHRPASPHPEPERLKTVPLWYHPRAWVSCIFQALFALSPSAFCMHCMQEYLPLPRSDTLPTLRYPSLSWDPHMKAHHYYAANCVEPKAVFFFLSRHGIANHVIHFIPRIKNPISLIITMHQSMFS